MSNTVKNIQKKKKKGFTLIELIIVIAIIGILALIAIPRFGAAKKNADIKADIANAKTIFDATAREIAEDTLEISETGTVDLDDLADTLQTIPEPKALGTEFVVTVTGDNDDITVSVNASETEGEATTVVYPEGAGIYEQ